MQLSMEAILLQRISTSTLPNSERIILNLFGISLKFLNLFCFNKTKTATEKDNRKPSFLPKKS